MAANSFVKLLGTAGVVVPDAAVDVGSELLGVVCRCLGALLRGELRPAFAPAAPPDGPPTTEARLMMPGVGDEVWLELRLRCWWLRVAESEDEGRMGDEDMVMGWGRWERWSSHPSTEASSILSSSPSGESIVLP